MRIDLNADIGEGLDEVDRMLAPMLTSASIACGGHAGDMASMAAAVDLCRQHGLRAGAHPSYLDRVGFGRTSVEVEATTLTRSIVDQVERLSRIAEYSGTKIAYIKPHGALYNDTVLAGPVAEAVLSASRLSGLPIMCLAGSALADEADSIREGFIDRGYLGGRLIPRGKPGDLISSPEDAAEQALSLAPSVDSLCIHSDTTGAPILLAAARRALQASGYEIEHA